MKRYTKFKEGVADIILDQLGGRKFSTMTGAKNFIGDKNSLAMSIGSGAKNGINFMKVTLNGRDTYDIEFGKKRGIKYTPIKEVTDIYAEDLQRVFTNITGFDTRL